MYIYTNIMCVQQPNIFPSDMWHDCTEGPSGVHQHQLRQLAALDPRSRGLWLGALRCGDFPGAGGSKMVGWSGREKSMEKPWKRLKEMGKPWEISWKIVGEWCLMKIIVVGIVVQAFSVRITILQGFFLKDIRVCKLMVAYRFDKHLYFFPG